MTKETELADIANLLASYEAEIDRLSAALQANGETDHASVLRRELAAREIKDLIEPCLEWRKNAFLLNGGDEAGWQKRLDDIAAQVPAESADVLDAVRSYALHRQHAI
jgi:hypothetical protein